MHIGPQVAAAGAKIEEGVNHPLARPVVGVLAAAAGRVDREAISLQQIAGIGAGTGGVHRRMFQQPNQLRRGAASDGGDPRLHFGDGGGIVDRQVADPPFRLGEGFGHLVRLRWGALT